LISTIPVQNIQSTVDNVNDPTLLTEMLAARPNWRGAAWIAVANIVLFAFRPDPDITWPARVPRILWEFLLWLHVQTQPPSGTSQMTRTTKTTTTQMASLSWRAFLLGTTGLADLFLWAPIYGAFVNFRTCDGGWLQPKVCRMDPIKGYSRLWVVFQAVIGGMVYLVSVTFVLCHKHVVY
jgi:hypothetical protein